MNTSFSAPLAVLFNHFSDLTSTVISNASTDACSNPRIIKSTGGGSPCISGDQCQSVHQHSWNKHPLHGAPGPVERDGVVRRAVPGRLDLCHQSHRWIQAPASSPATTTSRSYLAHRAIYENCPRNTVQRYLGAHQSIFEHVSSQAALEASNLEGMDGNGVNLLQCLATWPEHD